jgi:tRNA pseudouridine55 synthase
MLAKSIMDGILIVNKSTGPTSHDIVDKIRKIIAPQNGVLPRVRIGHAGTLDPFARGILIILIGKATKLQSKFMEMEKTYIGTLKLGEISDTYDITGKIKNSQPKAGPPRAEKVQKILKTFIGEISQVPPIYSAIKIHGQAAYKMARRGEKPKLKSRKIEIYGIKILNYKWPRLKIEVKCGKGTYIRSLTNDIGNKLGCGAYLEELTRTGIGKLKIKNSINLKNLNNKNWTKKLISDTL